MTGAKHITLSTLADRLAELPAPGEDFYVICHGRWPFEPRGNLPARMPATRLTTLLAAPAHGSPPVCR